ncbi:glycosyltransferase family 4 protein [Actinoplanes regularis]|uniref:Rhamnosyl/mannosyltransferase n=1 Tax=Actinoplanes regularis TaxID=52697 RepID=A0A238X5R6_9ACTN|nr:glycosyltransferase family 4 protein [Actinoplanes regularis]GIE86488.1 glycosyl transferase [Actinoplanes regularis]GLW33448.1 glycosyl transferase [Actinoplanes regularis]SNR54405.1 rhamnosyl/mannosyltransferase [Actinoplanes regularis]
MTFIQISPYYPPHLGGMERVVENVAAGLGVDSDVTVLTTTLGSEGAPRRSRNGRVTVRRHRAWEFAHTPIAPGLLRSLWRTPKDAVLHLHSAHALIPEVVAVLARLRGQRFLLHFHLDVDASGPLGRLLPYYKKHLFGRVMRAAAGVIVLTESQAEFVERRYGVPRHRIHIVPNGVAEEHFLPPRRARVGEPLRLLYVGRLSPQKNVTRLLDALALCRQPIHLTVVGDGEQRQLLEEQARTLRLENVTFAGSRLGAELREQYAHADAFVLPSDREGMPLVALEAMAAGLPVVATAVPGNIELLQDTAVLTEPSPEALAAGLDSVAGDAELFERLARQSADKARLYTWTAVVDSVKVAYAEALA